MTKLPTAVVLDASTARSCLARHEARSYLFADVRARIFTLLFAVTDGTPGRNVVCRPLLYASATQPPRLGVPMPPLGAAVYAHGAEP